MDKISEFSKKLEKWKIFRFIGKFSSTANIPIHQILEENFPILPNLIWLVSLFACFTILLASFISCIVAVLFLHDISKLGNAKSGLV